MRSRNIAIRWSRSPKVAADLDVDTLLTGNFIREGDDLRITCQLVDVKTRNILWKGAFDLRYQNLLTVQDQVAEQIIQGLELNLSSSEAARLKLDEPANPLAYEYYLRGVDLYSRSDFPLAIQMLEKSAEIDPQYALTWAYLGRSYNAGGSFQLEGRDYYQKAQAAFDRALALQPAQIETRSLSRKFPDRYRQGRASGAALARVAEDQPTSRRTSLGIGICLSLCRNVERVGRGVRTGEATRSWSEDQ